MYLKELPAASSTAWLDRRRAGGRAAGRWRWRALCDVYYDAYNAPGGDMITQSVRIPDDLAHRLRSLAETTRRSKSSFIVDALERYLDDLEDLEVALARFRDPGAEWVDHDEVGRELGLD